MPTAVADDDVDAFMQARHAEASPKSGAPDDVDAFMASRSEAKAPSVPRIPPPAYVPPGTGATGIGAAPLSTWQRVKAAVGAGAPEGSVVANATGQTGTRGTPQLITPEAAMTETEQEKHPIAAGAAEFAGGMTSPDNLMLLGLTGGAGQLGGPGAQVAKRLLSAGFRIPMLISAAQQTPAISDAFRRNDYPTALRLLTKTGLTAGLAGLGGKDMLEEAPPAPATGFTNVADSAKLAARVGSEKVKAPEQPEGHIGPKMEPLAPESPATLQAQTDALAKGTNKTVYFPKGTESVPPPPENAKVTIVPGDQPGAGTWYHAEDVKPLTILKAVQNGTFGELLGNHQSKTDAISGTAPAAVVARDGSGTEVKASLVDSAKPEIVAAQAATLQRQFPKAEISVEPAEKVVGERLGEKPRAAEKSAPATASPETPQVEKRSASSVGTPPVGTPERRLAAGPPPEQNRLLTEYRRRLAEATTPHEQETLKAQIADIEGTEGGLRIAGGGEEMARGIRAARNSTTGAPRNAPVSKVYTPAPEDVAPRIAEVAPEFRDLATQVQHIDAPLAKDLQGLASGQLHSPEHLKAIAERVSDANTKAELTKAAEDYRAASTENRNAPRGKTPKSAPGSVLEVHGQTKGVREAKNQAGSELAPEVRADAEHEIRAASELASTFERPGRYFAGIGQTEQGIPQRSQSSAKGIQAGGVWYGVGSAKNITEASPQRELLSAEKPSGFKKYFTEGYHREYQVAEQDYIDHHVGKKLSRYEQGVKQADKELAALGPKATSSRRQLEVNKKHWQETVDRLKDKGADPREVQGFREDYIEMVKKAISNGEEVPEEVIKQRPEFQKAKDARARYEKGRHTSFANKSAAINDTMRDELGFKVKRQDGKAITEDQIGELKKGVGDVEKAIGPLADYMRGTDLTIAHTSGKYPFLDTAAGLYHSGDKTITVGVKDFLGRPIHSLAHEMAHWLDFEAGRQAGVKERIHAGSKFYDATSLAEAQDRMPYNQADAGKDMIRSAVRSMSDTMEVRRFLKKKYEDTTPEEHADLERIKVHLGHYWRSPREVFARLIEQYVATKNGPEGTATDKSSYYEKIPGYWSKEEFAKLMPDVRAEIDRRVALLDEKYGDHGSSAPQPGEEATKAPKIGDSLSVSDGPLKGKTVEVTKVGDTGVYVRAAEDGPIKFVKNGDFSVADLASGKTLFANPVGVALKEGGNLLSRAWDKNIARPLIDKVLKIGDKYAKAREADPAVAEGLHLLDNAPVYLREKATQEIKNVVGGLSRAQEKLFTLMADADSRVNLERNHPAEFKQAQSDPAVQGALKKYRPLEQELTAAREKMGGATLEQDYLRRVYDKYVAGVGKSDAKGAPSEIPPAPFDRVIRPQKLNNKSREATAEYHYQQGLHEFGPAFATKYVATHLKALRDEVAQEFLSKATTVMNGAAEPHSIEYDGKTYFRPDVAKDMRDGGEKNVQEYNRYDPTQGERFPVPVDGKFLGPKDLVQELMDYGRKEKSEPGSIRRFLQEQILGFGFGVPHIFNIMRRVTQNTAGGATNPVAWARAMKVAFGKELRERGVEGLNDPTFDMLAKHGGISTGEVANLKRYIGGNLNPANWLRGIAQIGHKFLFEPGSFGGFGGFDQRARLYVADLMRSQNAKLTDAEISRSVNDALGEYSRANWTDRQKLLGRFMMFPGWDFSSLRWVLQHPVRTTLPPAILTLLANRALHMAGKNRGEDENDISSVHYGDRAFSTGLIRESMARNLFRPALNYAQSKIRGESDARALDEASRGVTQGIGGLLNTIRPDLSGFVALAVNRENLSSSKEIVSKQDYNTPGKILPSKALEKQAAFAVRRALPALERMMDSNQDVDLRSFAGGNLGFPNYKDDAEKHLIRNLGEAERVSQSVSKLAKTNPERARQMMRDPDNATYALFKNDLMSLSKSLHEIDQKKEAVDGSKLPDAQKKQRLQQLDQVRGNVLSHADGLDRLLFDKRMSKRAAVAAASGAPFHAPLSQ